jgi:hypothetical protein
LNVVLRFIILSAVAVSFIAFIACSTALGNSKSSSTAGSSQSSSTNSLPSGVTAVVSNNGGTISINSRYLLNNNEWNVEAAPAPYNECIFLGSLNGTTFFGWQWSWNNTNDYNVLTYPEVLCGDSPWSPNPSHPADFPFTISNHTVSSSFNISQTTSPAFGGDTYDLAYDIWIISNTCNTNSFSSTNIKCEVMIWLASTNTIPDGLNPSGSISANGYNFNFYCNSNQSSGTTLSWIYAAFSAGSAIQILKETNFNITPFLAYLTNNGILNPGDYVCTVELGTEIAIGQGITVISNYSVNVQ